MKKGETGEGVVERLDFPNKGIIEDKEGQVTVKGVLPGQRVSYRVKKVRRGSAQADLLEVLERSPDENGISDCPHFGSCGGCSYRALPYEKQLELKSGQAVRLFREVIPDIDDIYEGIKESPVVCGFRNKMEFTFGDEVKDGPLSLGMHRRGSFYDIVTVDQCQIIDVDFRTVLKFTRDFFDREKIPFYHRMKHTGYLRHLLVRKAANTGEILVDLVTSSQIKDEDPACEGLYEDWLLSRWMEGLLGLKYEGRIAGILHTVNDSVADAVKNEGTKILFGQDFITERLLGLSFKISVFSFFQTNTAGAGVLYSTAGDYIGDMVKNGDKTVFDLYSGTGTIAQLLAPRAKKVIGVEIVEEAVLAASLNAKANGLSNCSFIAGDVLKVLDTIEEKPDYIILDPPRDGVHPKALKKIAGYGAENILYISCKPTSFVRDMEILKEYGYRAERLCCIDMFPASPNFETVVLMSIKCAGSGPKPELD